MSDGDIRTDQLLELSLSLALDLEKLKGNQANPEGFLTTASQIMDWLRTQRA